MENYSQYGNSLDNVTMKQGESHENNLAVHKEVQDKENEDKQRLIYPKYLLSNGGETPQISSIGLNDKPFVEEWDAYADWLLNVVRYPQSSVDVLKKTKPWARKMTSRLCVFLHFYRLDIPIQNITGANVDTVAGWTERGRIVWNTADFITVPVVRGNPIWFCERKAITLANLSDYPTAKVCHIFQTSPEGLDEDTAKKQAKQMFEINWELEKEMQILAERETKLRSASKEKSEEVDENEEEHDKAEVQAANEEQQGNTGGWFSGWFSWAKSPPLSPRASEVSIQSTSSTITSTATSDTIPSVDPSIGDTARSNSDSSFAPSTSTPNNENSNDTNRNGETLTRDSSNIDSSSQEITKQICEATTYPLETSSVDSSAATYINENNNSESYNNYNNASNEIEGGKLVQNAGYNTNTQLFDLKLFLEQINLTQYLQTFLSNGYDDPAVIKQMDDHDFDLCGVLPGHRKKMKLYCEHLH